MAVHDTVSGSLHYKYRYERFITSNLKFFFKNSRREGLVEATKYFDDIHGVSLPQQNVLLIKPQQNRIVVLTISHVAATTVIVTIHIVDVTIEIVIKAILAC